MAQTHPFCVLTVSQAHYKKGNLLSRVLGARHEIFFRGRADDREHDGQHCTHVDEIDGGRLVRSTVIG